jgi:hypothetical protein
VNQKVRINIAMANPMTIGTTQFLIKFFTYSTSSILHHIITYIGFKHDCIQKRQRIWLPF